MTVVISKAYRPSVVMVGNVNGQATLECFDIQRGARTGNGWRPLTYPQWIVPDKSQLELFSGQQSVSRESWLGCRFEEIFWLLEQVRGAFLVGLGHDAWTGDGTLSEELTFKFKMEVVCGDKLPITSS